MSLKLIVFFCKIETIYCQRYIGCFLRQLNAAWERIKLKKRYEGKTQRCCGVRVTEREKFKAYIYIYIYRDSMNELIIKKNCDEMENGGKVSVNSRTLGSS